MVNGKFDAAFTSTLITGAMAWISFVDTSLLKAFATEEDSDTLVKVFSVWWPLGKKFMLPCLFAGVGTQIWAAVESKRYKLYFASALSLTSIGLWTGAFMSEDITSLLGASCGGGGEETRETAVETAKRFCTLHHPRLGFALASSGLSLWGLAFPIIRDDGEKKKKKKKRKGD
jgi:hypothetical protein